MVTAAEWSSEHEALRTQIGNALSNPLVSESQLNILFARIRDLESKLEQIVPGASGAELRRRRGLLERLKSQVESAQTSLDSTSQQLEQQHRVMNDHNKLISDLERGVGRLHHQANLIDQEANLHVRLLDDMDIDVDKASEGLRQEARHAERIRQKSKTFWLYVIIVVLVMILVLLISIGL